VSGIRETFMYSLNMARTCRALASGLMILWVVVPQIQCLMPDAMTESEQQCCQQMANNCSATGMSHECCQTVQRPDVATVGTNRSNGLDFTIAIHALHTSVVSVHAVTPAFVIGHELPQSPGIASLNLRI